MAKGQNSSSFRKKRLSVHTPENKFRLRDIMDNGFHRLAIPVGPRFQAEVPAWNGLAHHDHTDHDSSKFLGTPVWPIKGRNTAPRGVVIGKGRSKYCKCVTPGSVECVKHHVTDKRVKLQYELGSVFWQWGFKEMGEEVSESWSLQEQRNFDALVRANPVSEEKSFVGPALRCFPSKKIEDVVSYYFNVFVPRRIRRHTVSGRVVDDSDGEDGVGDCPKRKRGDESVVRGRKNAKSSCWYLTGLR